MSLLYIGHSRASSLTTRKLYGDGTAIWSRDHGNDVAAVAVDSDGNVYTAGRSATSGYYNAIRKYTSAGTAVTDGWPVNIGNANQATSLAVDGSGAVYVGSLWSSSSSRAVQKYASTGGSVVWQSNIGHSVYGLAIADDGHVIAVGARISNNTIRKLNASSGAQIWAADHGAITRAVAVDDDGAIYTGGDASSSVTTRKWNTGGTEITTDDWPVNGGDAVYAVAVRDGLLVTGGLRTSSLTTRAYDTADGTVLWTADHGDVVQAVAIDDTGAVYAGGVYVSGVFLRKYLSDGTPVTITWPAVVINALVATASPPLITTAPGLSLPLALAIPTTDVATLAPALALPLAIAAPSLTLPPSPPDWRGGPAQTIYRCYLTGGPALIELPLAAFQCRRRLGDSTWLVLEVPADRAEWATLLTLTPLKQVVIYAGVRTADGTETLGEFLRAWLTEIERERNPHHAGLHLTGRIVPTPYTSQTRTLRAITALRKVEGRWRVTCAVDPLLRPNDTALFGESSMAVGALAYRISPDLAEMTVEELA